MKKLLFIAFAAIAIISCRKESQIQKSKPADKPGFLSFRLGTGQCDANLSKLENLKVLMQAIMETAKYSWDFKAHVYSTCAAEAHGDYYVRVSELLEYNANNNNVFWTSQEAEHIQCVVNRIKEADAERPEEPIIFVPLVEDINLDSLLNAEPAGVPEGVIGDLYDSVTQEAPAYQLNSNDILVKYQDVSEAYAWTHEVWVINQEEEVTNPNSVASPVIHNNSSRFNGQSEYGAIINVTNIGAIEPWVSGKVELKFIVFNQSGAKINELELSKTKRKNVDNKWKDFNKFLFNWNTSNIGNFVIEAWLELDGGTSTSTVSATFPGACNTCPSTSVSYTKTKSDDNLGQTIIQFTDPVPTTYSVSHANVQHKN